MEISAKYNPQGIEQKWYDQWMAHKLFSSVPDDRPSYTIVIPPPNVTGILHMGHMLNNTIQDILVRRARMLGYNACWVPGTDHASIATETKVVNQLKEQGIAKEDITREEFLGYAFEWKEKYGGIILDQLQKLGCSCDWERTRFTMEPDLSEAVIDSFIDLHKRGYIYHGTRMINWDPVGKTALSDEEVNHEEQNAKLYYVKYKLENSEDFISIATTRPETIMGDTAVCVHPDDERYQKLIGTKCIVPLVNRKVPIIADDYIDPEFGTGALKVTPAHDINDYEIGKRHNLDSIDVFNEDATISEAAGVFVGEDRFKARKLAALELENLGVLIKTEEIVNKVGKSERTKAVIEPRLSAQWFVDMKKFMADYPEVLSQVMDDEIQFHPPKFKNTYNHWLTNIKDWCISRQLWWGHRIPAWYTPNGAIAIAKTAEEALVQLNDSSLSVSDLRQDEDVLDTWFSSWLWPISVFNGFQEEGQKELDYYYPTSDLVTAPDIIFFWVARMIMAGHAFEGKMPFKNVYFTGIVRDKERRKMSKSLGNSPDPFDLMGKYGTDGVRMGLMLSAPAGNDILFDETLCEQGRNFCNKLWNSFRLLKGLEVTETQNEYYTIYASQAHTWMEAKIARATSSVNDHFDNFRISDALMELYKLTRDDFSGWYLEMIKPTYGDPIPQQDLDKAINMFDAILRLLHPFMPFITEELWQEIENRNGEFINRQDWPNFENRPTPIHANVFDLISEIRAKRNENGISPKVVASIALRTKDNSVYQSAAGIIEKLANVETMSATIENGFKALIGTDEVEIGFKDFVQQIDTQAIEGEIKRLKGFLIGIGKKLSNEKFMANAKPEVIANEEKKKSDTLSKIASLEKQLSI
ncbi:MAG: valine--tRNA ligase [Bacteroidetes bacterium]|nr:MAG: valine--tRNA ligase [Bacteroidota bacterium]